MEISEGVIRLGLRPRDRRITPSSISIILRKILNLIHSLLNIQRLLRTVIKLHFVKEAIQSSSLLPFITNFNLFVNTKTLTDVFQGRNPTLLLQIQSGARLI